MSAVHPWRRRRDQHNGAKKNETPNYGTGALLLLQFVSSVSCSCGPSWCVRTYSVGHKSRVTWHCGTSAPIRVSLMIRPLISHFAPLLLDNSNGPNFSSRIHNDAPSSTVQHVFHVAPTAMVWGYVLIYLCARYTSLSLTVCLVVGRRPGGDAKVQEHVSRKCE